MAALGARTKLSPGAMKALIRLSSSDGMSMGEVARRMGCDPSYVTALVDDLAARELATREPNPVDRRVKTVVLTDAGRALVRDIEAVLSVPPASFAVLSEAELRQLHAILRKVLDAESGKESRGGSPAAAAGGVTVGAVTR
jgi:DNA-binding MarR family transcriptional regulator